MSVARSVRLEPAASNWIPPSDGSVERVETALLTIWSAAKRFSRETESFIDAPCIFLSGSDVLSVVDGCGEPTFMASPVGFRLWTGSVDGSLDVGAPPVWRALAHRGALVPGGWCQ